MKTPKGSEEFGRTAISGSRFGNLIPLVLFSVMVAGTAVAQQTPSGDSNGLRGDAEAIADAEAMVESMGGMSIWKEVESVHFVHDWEIFNRHDRYRENEILDLTGPRAYVTMDSEVSSLTRAYSPEHEYWKVAQGEYSTGSPERLENAMERAPFSIYRIARGIARGDDYYHVSFGEIPDLPGPRALEFRGPDDVPRGWILLNGRNEPIIWATTQYQYVFGPLKQFGNLWVPNWATTSKGLVRYEMVSLQGSSQKPELELFAPPSG
jgi:hypothetical protein